MPQREKWIIDIPLLKMKGLNEIIPLKINLPIFHYSLAQT